MNLKISWDSTFNATHFVIAGLIHLAKLACPGLVFVRPEAVSVRRGGEVAVEVQIDTQETEHQYLSGWKVASLSHGQELIHQSEDNTVT
jgi:hypothetical protein